MNSFSENERQIRSLADTLPKDLQLTASVWLILRRAPKEHQGKLLHLYETLFRTGAQSTQLLRPDTPGQPPFALLLANSFLDLSFHLNFPPDTFYREVCQWLMRQSSFSEQAQLLHYIVTDARLPYFQFDPKLRQGMSSQHFNLLTEDIPAETKTNIRRLVHRDIPHRHWRYRQLLTILDSESDPDQRAALLAFITDESIRRQDFEKRIYILSKWKERLSNQEPDFTSKISSEPQNTNN